MGAIIYPYNLAVAMNLVPGATTDRVRGYIGTSAVTTKAIRATNYTQPVAAAQRSLSSSSASDAAAGIGAQTVKITYYDGTMAGPFTDTITLNGTTAVATNNSNIQFIDKIEVVTAGSNTSNVGTISLFVNNSGGGGTIGTIAAGDNSTFWCHHYVPTGVTCYVTDVDCGATITSGLFQLIAEGSPLSATAVARNVSGGLRHGSGNQVQTDLMLDTPLVIVGPEFIVMTETPDAVTASTVHAHFSYIQQ